MSVFVLPGNRQPPIDPRSGTFDRSWYLFFQSVFDRIGGATGTGNAAIDAALEDLRVSLNTAPDSTAQLDALTKALSAYQAAQAIVDAAQTAAINALDVRVSSLEVWEAFA